MLWCALHARTSVRMCVQEEGQGSSNHQQAHTANTSCTKEKNTHPLPQIPLHDQQPSRMQTAAGTGHPQGGQITRRQHHPKPPPKNNNNNTTTSPAQRKPGHFLSPPTQGEKRSLKPFLSFFFFALFFFFSLVASLFWRGPSQHTHSLIPGIPLSLIPGILCLCL